MIACRQLKFIAAFLITFLCLTALTQNVSAANTYPDTRNSTQEPKALAARAGDWRGKYNCPPPLYGQNQDPGACATGITTGKTIYQLFKPVSNTGLRVDLIGACTGDNSTPFDKPSQPNKGQRDIRVSFYQAEGNGASGNLVGTVTSSSCSQNNLILNVPDNAFTLKQKNRYGSSVETAYIEVTRESSDSGQRLFRPRVYAAESYVFNAGARDFAVVSTRENGDDDYNFHFKVDCQKRGSATASVRDLDYFTKNPLTDEYTVEPNTNIKGYLRTKDGQQIGPSQDASSAQRNGQKMTFNFDLSSLVIGQEYRIQITNISNGNGLNVLIPYSEYGATAGSLNPEVDCKKPDPPPGVSCTVEMFGNGNPSIPDSNGVVAGSQFSAKIIMYNRSGGNLVDRKGQYDSRYGNAKTGYQTYTDSAGEHQIYFEGFLVGAAVASDPWGAPNGITGGGLAPVFMGGIPNGGQSERTVTLSAPNDQSTRELTVSPVYWGEGGIANSTTCKTTVTTYQRYNFSAYSGTRLEPDLESPRQAIFSTGIDKRGVADVDSTSTRVFYKRRNGSNSSLPGFGPSYDSRSFQSVGYNDTHNIPPGSYILGDSWCVSVGMPLGEGWRSQDVYHNERNVYSSDCDSSPKVVNKPYIRTYGADTIAGGGFGTNCTINSGAQRPRILSFLRPIKDHQPPSSADPRGEVSNKSGSGSQLAAIALGDVKGFTSASLRNTLPQAPSGLTFANTAPGQDNIDINSDNPLLGGKMKGDGGCMPDYFASTQFPKDSEKKQTSSDTSQIDAGNLLAEGQTLRNISGNKLSLISSSPLTGQDRHTVFVDGDVAINSNITYDTNYGTGIQNIPSFTLVVKGNIYVDQSVTQLDGLYIAQPDGNRSNSGRIYTCAKGGNPVISSPTAIYNECGGANDSADNSRQLRVNGAFLAQRVVLNRVTHSIGDSTFREEPSNSKAAEVFSFSQEIYLSPPVFRSYGNNYDYISIKAPIL